jgi:hypothetical protein
MRSVRIGSRDAPRYFDAKGDPWPTRVYLDHTNIAPIDESAGDYIETRTARDTYTDITAREGQAWTMDYERGILTIYRYPGAGQVPAFHHVRDKFVKISYRIAAGGDLFNAGETTVGQSLTASTNGEIDVADASRLPAGGGVMLIDGSEYVYVDAVDRDANTVTIPSSSDRGIRRTPNESHDDGATIHYCPVDVRDAVAAKAAAELAVTEDFTEWLLDSNDLDRTDKISEWKDEWTEAVNSYSDRVGYS